MGIENGKVIADNNCPDIKSMIQNEFTKIDSTDDGWTIRSQGTDETIWKLSYPESHLHGGGPPKRVQLE